MEKVKSRLEMTGRVMNLTTNIEKLTNLKDTHKKRL